MEKVCEAWYCNGSKEEQKTASLGDWLLHLLMLPWKLYFNILNVPADLYNGWPCFVVSLALMGLVLGLVNEAAQMLGCVLNTTDTFTAMTFV